VYIHIVFINMHTPNVCSCVRVCLCACVRACVYACVHAYVCMQGGG